MPPKFAVTRATPFRRSRRKSRSSMGTLVQGRSCSAAVSLDGEEHTLVGAKQAVHQGPVHQRAGSGEAGAMQLSHHLPSEDLITEHATLGIHGIAMVLGWQQM